ncbi:WhiB family transcriptional regulator [Streptomyces sp. 1222.5]|uniref:WhiB family transcriptional regulator n=1 Tax=Streptomyces sp. 1222.5 TaxID=1881026 RepID=UPI003EB9F7C0
MSLNTGSVTDRRRATDWQDTAACARPNINVEVFHAREGDKPSVTQARSICGHCPSRIACLTTAFTEGDQWGIRAGLTPRQRTAHLKKANGNITRAVADALNDTAVLLKNLYWQHTETRGRHRVWLDHRDWVNVRGKPYTINRLAWIALNGHDPHGHVTRTCNVERCIAQGCLTDGTTRKQART